MKVYKSEGRDKAPIFTSTHPVIFSFILFDVASDCIFRSSVCSFLKVRLFFPRFLSRSSCFRARGLRLLTVLRERCRWWHTVKTFVCRWGTLDREQDCRHPAPPPPSLFLFYVALLPRTKGPTICCAHGSNHVIAKTGTFCGTSGCTCERLNVCEKRWGEKKISLKGRHRICRGCSFYIIMFTCLFHCVMRLVTVAAV